MVQLLPLALGSAVYPTLLAVVILILTIQSSFLTAVTIAIVTRLIVYATTCIALPVFRYRTGSPPALFTVPVGIVAAVLSLVLIGWLLTDERVRNEGLPILVAAVIGLVLYFAYRLYRGGVDAAASKAKQEMPGKDTEN